MIKTFSNKHLHELFVDGKTAKLDPKLHKKIMNRLDRLDTATELSELNVPGFNFHALNGFNPTRYTIHVNGPWTITFVFQNGDAYAVDFEQYH